MEKTDLRIEFTKETKARFNVEWVAYNDYVEWLEQRLVKLLTIPHVSIFVCPDCKGSNMVESNKREVWCNECKKNFRENEC